MPELKITLPGSKECTKCGQEKRLDQFCRCNKFKSGLNSKCKICLYGERKQYLLDHPEQAKKFNGRWDKEHPTEARARASAWRSANKERNAAVIRRWRTDNVDRNNELIRRWHKENPNKVKEYNAKKRATPEGRLNSSMGALMRHSLREKKARRHWEVLAGYTLAQLKRRIERTFLPGMSWENMDLWDIDHIIPIVAHNYNTPNDIDFKKCWALKNLRPLWKGLNRSKGGKVESPFQPSLMLCVKGKQCRQ